MELDPGPRPRRGGASDLRAVEGVEDIGIIHFGQVEAGGERMTGVSMQTELGAPVVQRRARPHAVGSQRDRARSEDGRPPPPRHRRPLSVTDPDAPDGEREAVVVGEVLMPTMDDNAFNEGIAMTPDALAAVTQTTGFDQAVVGFEDGIDEEEAARRVRDHLPEAISVYSFSSPPPDVANLLGVQFLPRVLGMFLGLLAIAAVGHALASSVRRRRHDLGVVRAVGFVARDVLRALTTQSWTLVAIGLAFGIPLGIALGRMAWQVVADADRRAGIRAHLSARAAGGHAARVRVGGAPRRCRPASPRRASARSTPCGSSRRALPEGHTVPHGQVPEPRRRSQRQPRGSPGDGRPGHRHGRRGGRRHRGRAVAAAERRRRRGVGIDFNDVFNQINTGGSSGTVDPADEPLVQEMSDALDDIQGFWAIGEGLGSDYQDATLVLFTGGVSTDGCGNAPVVGRPLLLPGRRQRLPRPLLLQAAPEPVRRAR